MSTVTKIRRNSGRTYTSQSHVIVHEYAGSIVVRTNAKSFRCDGCGLVWAQRWLAESCEMRKHLFAAEEIIQFRPMTESGAIVPLEAMAVTHSALGRVVMTTEERAEAEQFKSVRAALEAYKANKARERTQAALKRTGEKLDAVREANAIERREYEQERRY